MIILLRSMTREMLREYRRKTEQREARLGRSAFPLQRLIYSPVHKLIDRLSPAAGVILKALLFILLSTREIDSIYFFWDAFCSSVFGGIGITFFDLIFYLITALDKKLYTMCNNSTGRLLALASIEFYR